MKTFRITVQEVVNGEPGELREIIESDFEEWPGVFGFVDAYRKESREREENLHFVLWHEMLEEQEKAGLATTTRIRALEFALYLLAEENEFYGNEESLVRFLSGPGCNHEPRPAIDFSCRCGCFVKAPAPDSLVNSAGWPVNIAPVVP